MPYHGFKSKIIRGLVMGRISTYENREPSTITPTFDEALAAATLEDLTHALTLLIKTPHVKRTWRNRRMKSIADAMLKEARLMARG